MRHTTMFLLLAWLSLFSALQAAAVAVPVNVTDPKAQEILQYCLEWFDFEDHVRPRPQGFAVQTYRDALRSFYPKEIPLRYCSYNIPSPQITSLVLDAAAVRSSAAIRWCDNLVSTRAVPPVYHFDKLGAFLDTFVTVCLPPKSHGIPASNELQLGDPGGAIMAGSNVEIRSRQHRNASYVLFANLMLTKTVEVVNGRVRVPSAIGTTEVIAMSHQWLADETVMSSVGIVELVESGALLGSSNNVVAAIWIVFGSIHVVLFAVLIVPRWACIPCSVETRTRIRDTTATIHAILSIVVISLLGLDQGPAKFTSTKTEAWNLLVATGLYLVHGCWAWACLFRHVSAPTNLRVRWQHTRGRHLMDTTRKEMSRYRSGLAAPAPAVLAVPRVDEELGPLGDVYVAAIRAGKSEQVRDVGGLSAFFGPSPGAPPVAEADGRPVTPQGYGDAARDALYRAQGGAGGHARCCGMWHVGGLSIEDKEKLWNWALVYTALAMTIEFAAFGFLSYADVLRAVG